MMFNSAVFSTYRNDFPMMQALNRGKPLIFLDSAASSQKPQIVIDAMSDFYNKEYANIHRGIYEISETATNHYENVRAAVRDFIHAKNINEIVFVRGTTEGINFIANTLPHGSNTRKPWVAGDEVIITEMEHHANIVPWYILTQRLGIKLRIVPVTEMGELDMSAYNALFSERTKLVAVTHASNVLGTINPIKEMTMIAHQHGVPILVDGAQAVPHLPVDVSDLDCDFYTFSAHKLYGPTGIGVLYIKESLLHDLPPYQGGGNMIRSVSFDEVTFAEPPHCFEAGTPAIVEAIGLHAAISYVNAIGMDTIRAHELELLSYAEEQFAKHHDVKIYGTSKQKVGVISFTMDAIHPHDIGTILDHEGIASRAGHHCAMPLMKRFNVAAMIRIAFGIYNNKEDIDSLCRTFNIIRGMFA